MTNTADSVLDSVSVTSRIQASYDKYTAARARLLEAHTSLQNPMPVSENYSQSNNNSAQIASNATSSKPTNPISKLLPYLPHLANTTTNERALTQHTVYLAAHLAAADQEAQEALMRLSGESHLLPAAGGSREAGAWARTAAEAEAATEQLVKERLEESRKEVSSVTTIVDLCSLQSKVLDAM